MKKSILILLLLVIWSCEDKKSKFSAQQLVDKAITVSGGDLYNTSDISFTFRKRRYEVSHRSKKRILKRISITDSSEVVDIKTGNEFQRFINDTLVVDLPDSLAIRYGNSVNSVHYFAYLPYGLNDRAVSKELVGEATVKGTDYYKLKVTFSEEGGGDDFDDIYVYWINKATWKPDYLAYEFHVNGGGMRFREAYNERFVHGIRFVDYKNYKPTQEGSILNIDSLYNANELELLSEIKLENIVVTPGNYN
ncbi:MAG: deoxyribose-phosphate aldolase [Eudoraea sp.]|nr:deoxyribose-phosphate aldolase [Eudoraea sp.]